MIDSDSGSYNKEAEWEVPIIPDASEVPRRAPRPNLAADMAERARETSASWDDDRPTDIIPSSEEAILGNPEAAETTAPEKYPMSQEDQKS